MGTVNLHNQSGKHMLATRPAARAIQPAMRSAMRDGTITLDTSGIRRISVSFFDESLLMFKELLSETGDRNLRMVYHKAPQTDSLKNLVPNRGLMLSESPTGDWIITSRR